VIQIGKSEDSSNLYLSFCIKKENLTAESRGVVCAIGKQLLDHVSIIIDNVMNELRNDPSNSTYYSERLKNYSNLLNVVNDAMISIKVSCADDEEDDDEVREVETEVQE
jgi:hypothetical protein